jgi:hypothetical protein
MPSDPPEKPPASIFKPYRTGRARILRMLDWAEHHGITSTEAHQMIPGISYSTAANELGKLVREGLAINTGEQRATRTGSLADIIVLPHYAPGQS